MDIVFVRLGAPDGPHDEGFPVRPRPRQVLAVGGHGDHGQRRARLVRLGRRRGLRAGLHRGPGRPVELAAPVLPKTGRTSPRCRRSPATPTRTGTRPARWRRSRTLDDVAAGYGFLHSYMACFSAGLCPARRCPGTGGALPGVHGLPLNSSWTAWMFGGLPGCPVRVHTSWAAICWRARDRARRRAGEVDRRGGSVDGHVDVPWRGAGKRSDGRRVGLPWSCSQTGCGLVSSA